MNDQPLVSTVKDKIIEALKETGEISTVDVLERKSLSTTINYPAAYVFCFAKKKQSKPGGRKPYTLRIAVEVSCKNLQSENAAARGCDALAELVENALDGKDLGLEEIMPFDHAGTEFYHYDPATGVITYHCYFDTTIFKER